jgi:hypothetical protein
MRTSITSPVRRVKYRTAVRLKAAQRGPRVNASLVMLVAAALFGGRAVAFVIIHQAFAPQF